MMKDMSARVYKIIQEKLDINTLSVQYLYYDTRSYYMSGR